MLKMQMDARAINTRSFIAEIQKRPSIWDQTCDDYNNKDQKFDDWQELTLMFIPKDENFTPFEVKSFTGTLQRRWKNLRDCYTRELLRLMKVKASGNVDRKRGYIYFKQLSFLRKVVKPTKRSTDIPPNELEVLKSVLDSDDITVQSEDPLEEMETSTSVKTFEEEFQESSNTYVHLLSANGEEENIMTVSEAKNSSNGQTKKSSTRNSRLTKPTNAPEDCDTLFLMSLVRDLQEIPDEQKLEVKIELMQVLKRARLKALKGKESYCNSQQTKQQRLTIKDEADSESLEDIDEHSLDSIKDPTTPELLEEDNL